MLENVFNKITNATNNFNRQLHEENVELGKVVRLLCDKVTYSLTEIKQDQSQEE